MLKCIWQIFFYLFDRIYMGSWYEDHKKNVDVEFSSPRFSRLKTWNFTSGWVTSRAKRRPGDSWTVTSKQERPQTESKGNWELRAYITWECLPLRYFGKSFVQSRRNLQKILIKVMLKVSVVVLTSWLDYPQVSTLRGFWPNRKWNFTFLDG